MMKSQQNRNESRVVRAKLANIGLGLALATFLLHGCDASAAAASLSRSVEVDAAPSKVWSVVGPFCAIKDWHPVVGSCSETGKPPVRMLETKDGKTTFVELEVARNETARFYSYSFQASPFPVTHYIGTIWVVPAADAGRSTVLWTGTYTPLPGKEKEANDAFAGVYDSGLAALKTRFAP
jgi:hypothetical protein